MSKRTASKPMSPRTIRALAKTAGDRAPKTKPLTFGAREDNYWRQNGRKTMTPRQERRDRHKLNRSSAPFGKNLDALYGGAR